MIDAVRHKTGNFRITKKAQPIQMTDNAALYAMPRIALDNAIECDASNQPERKLYWRRCAMLAQFELRRRS
jgi:hypothetical protein